MCKPAQWENEAATAGKAASKNRPKANIKDKNGGLKGVQKGKGAEATLKARKEEASRRTTEEEC